MPFYPHPPNLVSVAPSDPGAITSATYQMLGLGVAGANAWVMTPAVTGRVMLVATGDITQSNTATTGTVQLSYSTGTAPANTTAVTGTQIGAQPFFTGLTGALTAPFSLVFIVTGLVVGTAYWFDIAAKSSANSITVSKLNCIAIEV